MSRIEWRIGRGASTIAVVSSRLGTAAAVVALFGASSAALAAEGSKPVRIHVSSASSGSVDGIAFHDDDILTYDSATGTWTMHFDGSDVGLRATDVVSFAVLDDGDDATLDPILMSLRGPRLLPDIDTTVDDSDIVEFTPTSLGTSTSGTFSLFFDGSDVGLTRGTEDIDAIGFAPDSRLLISTTGRAEVPATGGGSLSASDEDLLVFNHVSFGADTAGDWELYFDGSDVGLERPTEDVQALWVDPVTGDVYLTTWGNYSVPGLQGDMDDILRFAPASLGDTTSGVFSLFWDGAAHAFRRERVDGLSISFANSAPVARDDDLTTDEDTPLSGANLLADNGHGVDADPDGDPLEVTAVSGSAADVGVQITLPSGALLTVDGTGSLDYDPNGAFDFLNDGETAVDTAAYTISDGRVEASATVKFTIHGITDVPQMIVTNVPALTIDEGGGGGFNVRLAAEPAGTVLAFVASSDPGAVSVVPSTFTFTPQNFSFPQGASVGGLEDADMDDETVTLTLSSSGLPSATVTVSVVDDDLGPTCDIGGQPAPTDLPQVECDALVTLFNAANGPGWRNNDGWLTATDPCTWSNVMCSAGHVGALSLALQNVGGTLPAAIGDFSELKLLDITSAFGLTGTIPAEIGNLTQLETLILQGTRLEGPIPAEIGNLVNLSVLSLNGNQLSGPLPPELGNLVDLTFLRLNDNPFTGEIPAEIGLLTKLTSFHLFRTGVGGAIPAGIGNLVNLTQLLLDQNQLSGPVPGGIIDLAQVSQLRLGGNGCLTADAATASFLTALDPDWADGCPP